MIAASRRLVLGLAFFSISPAFSEESGGERPAHGQTSVFAVEEGPNRARSDIGMPLASFLLPGLDQWLEGQAASAATYSGLAISGTLYARSVARANHLGEASEDGDKELSSKDIAGRKYVLGGLIYQGAGGMSAYHSFRTAVRTRKGRGQYEFLSYEETPLEVMRAPFHLQYLKRLSTLVPLAIGGALAALQLSGPPPEDAKVERTAFTQADAFFTSAYSYNAGTHEEAVFRGWVMPVMMDYWQSPFWSNAAQALFFAASHLNTNPAPIPQLLLGYHLGNVTQQNGWRIGEAVFIHAWWNIIAFTTQYHFRERDDSEVTNKAQSILWLPPLHYVF